MRPMAIRPDVLGEVERGAEHAEGLVRDDLGAGDALEDEVEQRLDGALGGVGVVRGEAGAAGGENVGEVELLLVGA